MNNENPVHTSNETLDQRVTFDNNITQQDHGDSKEKNTSLSNEGSEELAQIFSSLSLVNNEERESEKEEEEEEEEEGILWERIEPLVHDNFNQYDQSVIQPLMSENKFSRPKHKEGILLIAQIPDELSLIYERRRISNNNTGRNISLIQSIESLGNFWFDESERFYLKENFSKTIPCFISPIFHEENTQNMQYFNKNGETVFISEEDIDQHEDTIYSGNKHEQRQFRISTLGTTHCFEFLNRAKKNKIVSIENIRRGFMGPIYYQRGSETELDDTQICITGNIEAYDKRWSHFSTEPSEEEFNERRLYAEDLYRRSDKKLCKSTEPDTLLPKIQAAVRESQEKLGLQPTSIHYLGDIYHTYTTKTKKTTRVGTKTIHGFYATYE